MPTYEYRCTNGHSFEVIQRMSDDPVETCEVCGAPVERVFHPIAVHFKGSGFYTTDYAKKAKAGAAKDGDSSSDSDGDSSSDSDGDSSSDSGGDSGGSSSESSSDAKSSSNGGDTAKSGSSSD